ncbi:MAG: hypothetical protein QM805_08490 [Pseudomonas sp.]
MILLIRGKAKKFNSARFKTFLRNHCGFSSSLSRLAAAKVSSGERVAVKLLDAFSVEALEGLGVLYYFSREVEKRAVARPL